MTSVEEYIDFLLDKLNELVIEDISYSDYDQMTDWLAEIRKQVKMLEKKQERMKPDAEISDIGGIQHTCPVCWGFVGYMHEHCENCGQKLDWED